MYCPQEPARALLQRRASSIASPTAGIQGFLKSPRQSLDGAERDRRGSSIPGHQRGAVMQQSSPTMTDATGLVSTLLPEPFMPKGILARALLGTGHLMHRKLLGGCMLVVLLMEHAMHYVSTLFWQLQAPLISEYRKAVKPKGSEAIERNSCQSSKMAGRQGSYTGPIACFCRLSENGSYAYTD